MLVFLNLVEIPKVEPCPRRRRIQSKSKNVMVSSSFETKLIPTNFVPSQFNRERERDREIFHISY